MNAITYTKMNVNDKEQKHINQPLTLKWRERDAKRNAMVLYCVEYYELVFTAFVVAVVVLCCCCCLLLFV